MIRKIMDHTSESYQRLVDEIYPCLVEVIVGRYQSNAHKSIQDAYRLDQDFLSLEPDNLQFALTYRKEIVDILDNPELLSSLVRLFVISTLEFTYENNQYISVGQKEESDLENIYQIYLQEMKKILRADIPAEEIKQQLELLIARHFMSLHNNLSGYLDNPISEDSMDNAIFNRVVCRQYSPALQLKILGIGLETIKRPVLDIGCGKTGQLVNYLNGMGVETYGVDRIVADSEYLTEADWLEFPLIPESWGTIISHMAFSNHFSFQHLYKNGKPEPYARQYMKILTALQPGGSFYYSPGLPFIEGLLPEASFTMLRRRITVGEHIQDELSNLPENALYASQVVKKTKKR
jgi:hypothetical protein